MTLQFLGQTCERHQALNPQTRQCYDVCPPGEVYKAQTGCEPDHFLKRHGVFIGTTVLIGTVVWLSRRNLR